MESAQNRMDYTKTERLECAVQHIRVGDACSLSVAALIRRTAKNLNMNIEGV